MADAEDDFTFPATTATPPPYFFESPPLWRPVSRLESSESVEDEGTFNLSSFEEYFRTCNGFTHEVSSYYVDNGEEEKMDLLWEDLNDKCSRNCGKMTEDQSDNSSPGRNVRICCVRTLKLSKANGHPINGLKQSILVLIRFLMKKGLAMHSSGTSVKKLAW